MQHSFNKDSALGAYFENSNVTFTPYFSEFQLESLKWSFSEEELVNPFPNDKF